MAYRRRLFRSAARSRPRGARRGNMFDSIRQDIRYAVRGLGRDPLLMAAATLTLAISIGANTTVFSLVNAILLRPLPFPSAERLYALPQRMGNDRMEA